jgi:hypothetical protein
MPFQNGPISANLPVILDPSYFILVPTPIHPSAFSSMLRTRLPAPAFCMFLAGLIAPCAHADPLADLAKYSVFSQVDLSGLSAGKILAQRGPSLDFPRDLTVQSLYLIHAPVARALDMHKQWDAGKHPELKVYLHHDFSTHPTLADFSLSLPGNSAVRRLADATGKLPDMGDLQLSKAEAAAFKGSTFPAFWSQLLLRRASAFLQRGFGGQPPYDSADGSVRVADEVSRLLREQPRVRAAFGPIIGRSALSGGAGSLPLFPYWELFDVEGEAGFSLGSASSLQSGDSAQMVDFQYYASGGYYTFLTLYQMWPVTIDGKPATLVWRVDSISSLSLADLRPFERMGSGAAMIRDVERIISFFQKDMGR